MIDIFVNGTSRTCDEAAFVESLLVDFFRGEIPRGVAVAINSEIVPRSAWSKTTLEAGARIEIVHATQGG